MGIALVLPLRTLPARTLYEGTLLALALAVLLTACFGRAGVQQVDGATVARLALLHLHGVPGEAAYVHEHRAPAPFVQDHCHAPAQEPVPQPGPYDTLAAASLAGAVLCTAPGALPVAPATLSATALAQPLPPAGALALPATPPPRAGA